MSDQTSSNGASFTAKLIIEFCNEPRKILASINSGGNHFVKTRSGYLIGENLSCQDTNILAKGFYFRPFSYQFTATATQLPSTGCRYFLKHNWRVSGNDCNAVPSHEQR
ncbi:hypothetical protein ASD75_10515 [Acidovorax sp. Root568]|nr:hypothetical protein ASD75_10515 [Acidovorax sp. Root568]